MEWRCSNISSETREHQLANKVVIPVSSNQKSLLRKLAFLFIFFSPFSAWLAISAWLRLPIALNIVLIACSANIIVGIILFKANAILEDREDLLLLFFLVIVWYSFFFGFFNQRSFNHSLSYTFSVLFLFLLSKLIFKTINIKLNHILKIAMWSVIVCNGIVVVEWILYNLFDEIIIRNFFLTGGKGTSNMVIYYQTFFWSVGGVGEEPGGTASLVNILFPFGLIALRNTKTIVMVLYILLHFISMIFMASAAGMVFLVVSLVVSSFQNIRYLMTFLYVLIFSFLLFYTIYEFNAFNSKPFFDEYIDYIEVKASLDAKNPSSAERKTKWTYAIRDWMNAPLIGNGPGYGVEQYSSGYFNTLLTLLADTGVVSTLLFVAFFVVIVRKILSLEPFIKYCLLASFIMLFLHSSVYYVYYHFPFWLLMIVVQQYYRENNYGQSNP